MKFTVIILIVAVIFTASAQQSGGVTNQLVKSCPVEDIECLRSSTELFLQGTAGGIMEHDIKPIDPLFLEMVSLQRANNMTFHFKNVTITGLKTLQILNFKLNTTEKSVFFATKEDANMVFSLIVEFTNITKNFTGTLTVKASAIETDIEYNYQIRNENGLDYFEIGPERITCKPTVEPEITFSPELLQAINNDIEAKKVWDEYNSHPAEYRKEALCDIIERSLSTIVHNLRAVANKLQKTAFFTNYN